MATNKRTREDIYLEYVAGDLDWMEAIQEIEKLGYEPREAEAYMIDREDKAAKEAGND